MLYFLKKYFCHTHSWDGAPDQVLDVIEDVAAGEGSNWRAKEVRIYGRWP